jgi:hypothetical protein
MKYKICFLSGAYRTVEADCFTMDEHLIVFVKDGSPILTCVASNVCYWHPEESLALPLAAQVGLFEGRV